MNHYSQNDEQEVILEYFKGRTGHFLDIGAYDGITLSNTRALLELGWTGTLVEPDPFNMVKLIENMKPFSNNVTLLAMAVSPFTCSVQLRMDLTPDRSWASSISLDNPGVLQDSPTKLIVSALTLSTLVNDPYPQPKFISLDAEWMDYLILTSTSTPDLKKCELICIEPSGLTQRAKMKEHLLNLGFVIHHETHENIIARNTP